jgi:hypothetical protein
MTAQQPRATTPPQTLTKRSEWGGTAAPGAVGALSLFVLPTLMYIPIMRYSRGFILGRRRRGFRHPTRAARRVALKQSGGREHSPESGVPIFRRKCDQTRNLERVPAHSRFNVNAMRSKHANRVVDQSNTSLVRRATIPRVLYSTNCAGRSLSVARTLRHRGHRGCQVLWPGLMVMRHAKTNRTCKRKK